MTDKKGYIYEHRLVMAKYLKRCLLQWEIVHHKNKNKLDNRLENLEVMDVGFHDTITKLENKISALESRVTILEAENILLKSQLRV